MCFSSVHHSLLHCQTSYLASPGPGSHFSASSNGSTWVLCMVILSQKFPRNSCFLEITLSYCWVSVHVFVMSTTEDGSCSHHQTLVANPPSFCWYSGKTKGVVSLPVCRGQQVEGLGLALLLCQCCLARNKPYKNWLLIVELVLLDSARCECGYGLEKGKNNF